MPGTSVSNSAARAATDRVRSRAAAPAQEYAVTARHLPPLTPMRMNQELAGPAVKNPRIIDSCVIIQ
jgi:hypothetical protein